MVTAGSILNGTFRFVRTNWQAVLVWTGLLLVSSLLSTSLLLQPFYAARLDAMQTGAPATAAFGSLLLMLALFTLLLTVLWAAVFRAVMRPEERSFAYLRLGMDELRLLGAVLVVMVGGYILFIILGVIVFALAGTIGSTAGFSAGLLVGVVFGITLLLAAIWFSVRISVFGPLTIQRRKIALGSAWSLTRGSFWPLFGAYLVIGLILIFAYSFLLIAQMGSIFPDMMNPTDPAAAVRVAEWQAARYGSSFSGGAIISSILGAILGGVGLALQAGSTAVAADRLLGNAGAPNDLRAVYE